MRITLEVRNGGVTESGLLLIDKEGNSFHWITKQISHPLFYTEEYMKVSMTVTDNAWGTGKNAKNVRIIK